MKSIAKYVPNLITITRIVMSFLFVYTIVEEIIFNQERSMILLLLFLAICASDLLDGRIARKTNSVSVFGAKLDVFADLLYIILSYVTLVTMNILPVWFLGFICFKFSEFVITSKFMRNNNKSSKNPFVFDKVGRVVAAIFFIIPGIACIYKCFGYYNMSMILNLTLFIIFLAGIYSSYMRIRSCIVVYKLENNRCI